MEGNTGDRRNTLTHETLVVLDRAQGVAQMIQHADKLLH